MCGKDCPLREIVNIFGSQQLNKVACAKKERTFTEDLKANRTGSTFSTVYSSCKWSSGRHAEGLPTERNMKGKYKEGDFRKFLASV